MPQILITVVNIVNILLYALQLLMLVRAVMSWLPFDDGSPLHNFVHFITEPLIIPVRAVVEKIPALRRLPLDISFFVTVLLLALIQFLLPSIRF